MPSVCPAEHLEKVRRVRQLLSSHSASEDLIRVGAYQKGADPMLDLAIAALPGINAFLQQSKSDVAPYNETIKCLLSLPV
jgi:flagellum-specific ATP synthase